MSIQYWEWGGKQGGNWGKGGGGESSCTGRSSVSQTISKHRGFSGFWGFFLKLISFTFCLGFF